ncbi:sulfite exporter TauE/SafE family protein [Elongatibacter sediminis]|uniref:Sulfite exporter TauE/SafE family protein n=1 Tax=Elongatibacter sediminis TaxID=3119006 RepID=A0AAW9R7A9_9GAMM
MTGPEVSVLVAAFMAGLLGSGHCFAMCGGIAGSLGAMAALPGHGGRGGFVAALQFNTGRILGYAALGALTAGALGRAGGAGGVPAWSLWLRGLTTVMILAIGLHYLVGWRGMAGLERAGGRLWGRIAPFAARAAARRDLPGRLLLGGCWGLLPCGLVYTVLLTAASTGSAVHGGLTMAAFGLGTWPSMLGLTLAAPSLAAVLSDRGFRRFVGLSLVLLSAWMAFTLWQGVSGAAHHAH